MDTSMFGVSITYQKVGPRTETPSPRDIIVPLNSTAGIVCKDLLKGTKSSGRFKEPWRVQRTLEWHKELWNGTKNSFLV